MKRAMRGFRNAIERGFGRWHGVDISGMDEMCHAAVSKCCYIAIAGNVAMRQFRNAIERG